MKHLKDWLLRLRGSQKTNTHVARAFHAGGPATSVRGNVLGIEPQGRVSPSPGDSGPISNSLLYFLDSLPLSEQTMQVAEELGAVLCLVTSRRMSVPPELPLRVEGRKEIVFHQVGRGLDRELIGELPADAVHRAVELLNLVADLADSHVDTIGRAMHLYYGACNLVERDVRSAYVLWVAALEILSRKYGNAPEAWSEWEDARDWDEAFASLGLSSHQAEAIRQKLLKNRHLRLKRTFADYVVAALPETFWGEKWEQWSYAFQPRTNNWSAGEVTEVSVGDVLPSDRAILRSALEQTYNTRSAYVHRGDVFSLSDSLRKTALRVTGEDPIPYYLLRLIVRRLILAETSARARAVS